MKDLRLLGRDLKDVLLLDNVVDNLPLFPENTIPLRKWTGSRSDTELRDMIPLLKLLSEVPDVTEVIWKTLN